MATYVVVGSPGNYVVKQARSEEEIASGMSEIAAQETANTLNEQAAVKKDTGAGYSTNPDVAADAQQQSGTSTPNTDAAMAVARSLFSFFPEAVLKDYANAWIKYDDTTLAIAEVRTKPSWKKEFGFLQRDDGSLIMSEAEMLSTKASYAETLREVDITDMTEFESKFNELISGEVSAAEFQQRVDLVYNQVVDQIPEVERLYRDRFGIELDQPTIFGALLDPDISDKVLKGDIQTLQLQAQASIRGFTQSFARFEELRKAGLTTQQAAQVYEQATGFMQAASTVGREVELETLEEAALGDVTSQQRLQRIQAEIQSAGGTQLGAASTQTGEVVGLLED